MSDITKNAIKEAFLELLDEKKLKEITVKDVTGRAGVSRNTFYYHFQDVPSLLEDMVKEECDKMIETYPDLDSIEDCMRFAVSFAEQNRKAVLHIYNSVERHAFETHLWRISGYAVRSFMKSAAISEKLREGDDIILEKYYRAVCFGVVMNWLEGGMEEDVEQEIARLIELKRGQAEEVILRSRH